jgi:archaeal flagellar protein FlaI
MYIEIKNEISNKLIEYLNLHKKNLFLNCPYNFKNSQAINIFNCKNCKDPKCLLACKKGAIYFSSSGVISIDQNLCDGCGECLKACEYNAIVINNKKAYKCDLCSNNSFLMPCYYNNKDILTLIYSEKLVNQIYEKYLGYIIDTNFKILKNISKENINKNHLIIEDTNKELRYNIIHQDLSFQEIQIINNILDQYKFKEINFQESDDISNTIKIDLEKELVDYCFINSIELDEDQFNYILELTYLNLYKFGPLTILLNDNDLEEITIININEPVFVFHRRFGWLKTNIIYISENILKDLINKLCWESNKFITLKNPLLDSTISDNSRLNAVINPITSTCSLTIRKFNKKEFTIIDLIKLKTISLEACSFLSLVFLTDSNVFVVGNTGSGKTTTLNSLLKLIPLNERIITVEEVREIRIPHKHKVNLLVNKDLKINLEKLVINTLRMRPDRVIIGEIRSRDECFALVDSLLCGQAKGTYTTFHSQSSRDAIQRLISYGVLENDLGAVDLIVNQRRYNKYNNNVFREYRTVFEISEVLFENNKIILNTLYEFDISKDKLIKKNNSIKIFKKLQITYGINTYKELNKLLKSKEKEISKVLNDISNN